MGGYSAFPALAIRTPESPLQQVAQAQQIIGQRQAQQLQQLEIQQQTRNLADQDAATRAMSQWDGKDYSELPTLVKNALGHCCHGDDEERFRHEGESFGNGQKRCAN